MLLQAQLLAVQLAPDAAVEMLGLDRSMLCSTCVMPQPARRVRLAAELHEPKSGRRMKVSTNAPGLQFYSGERKGGSLLCCTWTEPPTEMRLI